MENELDRKRNIVSIPLIPHHEHRRRRLLEVGADTSRHLGRNILTVNNSSQTKRPRQYQRDLRLNNQQQKQNHQPVRLFQGLGTHYADIWCGTPPQRQTVIVDTGSQMTAFPCSQCRAADYHHIDEPFRQELSSTFHEPACDECSWGDCNADPEGKRCTFTADYQEGSNWTAVEVFDVCYIGGLHNLALPTKTTTLFSGTKHNPHTFELRFGCQTKISGDFVTQMADGIMGMDIGSSTIWNQMYQQHKIKSTAFSLCFQRKTESERTGTDAGAMTLGGADERLHSHTMVYAPTEPGALYAVQLRGLYLRSGGGESVMVKPDESPVIIPVPLPKELNKRGKRHVIVDSGTTDSYFTHLMRNSFEQVWLEAVGNPYVNDPVQLTEEQLHALPTFLLQFVGSEGNQQLESDTPLPLANELDPDHPNDILIAVPPSHYMEYQEEQHGYVAGFYFDEPEGIVIGANVMMQHDIMFDIQNSRVGWAESNCNYNTVAEKTAVKDAESYISPSSYRYRGPAQAKESTFVSCSTESCWHGVGVMIVLLGAVCCRLALTLLRRERRTRNQNGTEGGRSYLQKSSSYAVRSSPKPRGSRRIARRTVSEVAGGALSSAQQHLSLASVAEMRTSTPTRTRSKRGGVLRSRSTHCQKDIEVFEMATLLEDSS